MTADIVTERLPKDLDRSRFDCGIPVLNRYFHELVGQDIKRGVTACFVALDRDRCVAGQYTLAEFSIGLGDLPEAQRKKLPHYGAIPCALVGRLAVSITFQSRGIRSLLVFDAFARARQSDLAAYCLQVDAKDERAAAFYRKLGFIPIIGKPLALFQPISSVNAKR